MTSNSSKGALRIRTLAIILLLLMPVAALGSRFGLWPFTIGLLLLLVSFVGSLIIQVINAIWLLRKPNPETKSVLRWASLFALPGLVIFATIISGPRDGAMIHNISTDTENPPNFIAALALRGENSNPVNLSAETIAIQQQAFPNINPIISDKSPDQAFNLAVATTQSMGWEIHSQQPQQGRIEAIDTSFWFGFKDDIAIRISPDNSGSRIDLHSVSRVGQGDMGANAKRIIRFSETFKSNDK